MKSGAKPTVPGTLGLAAITDAPKTVVHILPYEAIGGVEGAVRTMDVGPMNGIEFHKCFLADKGSLVDGPYIHLGRSFSENDIINYWAAIKSITEIQPELVIASLWRSCLVLLAIKFIRPRTRAVLFLHLPETVHFLDRWINWLGMQFATEIWADSAATLDSRVPARLRFKSRTISFLTQKVSRRPSNKTEPKFIFWGRLDRQKGLGRALKLFAQIYSQFSSASFTVIGPDHGEQGLLEDLCKSLEIDQAVRFEGPKSWDEICELASQHFFYLQTSKQEGMAMSVVEAMQLGLVPVVTPVGEIANYCSDGENAVLVVDDAAVVPRVAKLIEDSKAYHRLAMAAQGCWQSKPLYRDDVLAACRTLLAKS